MNLVVNIKSDWINFFIMDTPGMSVQDLTWVNNLIMHQEQTNMHHQ